MKAKNDMTTDELRIAAREYDAINNEGYEGYNPYREEIERREYSERASKPETKTEKLERLEHELSVKNCSIARESGTYDENEVNAIRAEIETLESEIKKEEDEKFFTEWTREVTIERRKKWNAEATKPGATMMKVIIAVGFSQDKHKKAIEHYGL